ncbi:MAG TPA: glycosyltransferase family 9 protein [Phycisphaerae bacterium]|nr:glycosyltransferase family 9 protein [Phycisphaerae bacterium]
MKHIVIIHTGGIGDLVQTLPTLESVRQKWPQTRLTFIGRPERAVLARLAGAADVCLDVETCGLWRIAAGAKNGGDLPPALAEADLVLDFLFEGRLASALERTGAWVVSPRPLPPADWAEPAARWIFEEVAKELDLPKVPLEPRLRIDDAALEASRKVLAASGIRGPARQGVAAASPAAVLHIGSGSRQKNWPAGRFADLARRLREEMARPVVWLVGPAEEDWGLRPPAESGDAVIAQSGLDQLAGILALADVYIGNDSGITQIAAAVRRPDGRATPTVAIFGPSNADVWGPRGEHVRVVRSPDGTMGGIHVERVWAELRFLVR